MMINKKTIDYNIITSYNREGIIRKTKEEMNKWRHPLWWVSVTKSFWQTMVKYGEHVPSKLLKIQAQQDSDWHRYMIPSDMIIEFNQDDTLYTCWDMSLGDFESKWDKYDADWDLQKIQLYADIDTEE